MKPLAKKPVTYQLSKETLDMVDEIANHFDMPKQKAVAYAIEKTAIAIKEK